MCAPIASLSTMASEFYHQYTPTTPSQQAKKAAEAAAKPAKAAGAMIQDDSTEEVDPTLYFENRVKAVEAKKAKGINPYPHKFAVSISLPEFIAKYSSLEAGQQLSEVTVSVAGAWVPGHGQA